MADTKGDIRKLQTQDELERILDFPSKINTTLREMKLEEYPSAQEISTWLAPEMDPIIKDQVVKFNWQTSEQNTHITVSRTNDKNLFHYKITEPSGDSRASTWQVVSEGKEEIKGISYDKKDNTLLIQGENRLFTVTSDGQIGSRWSDD